MEERDKEILFKTLSKKINWILDTPYSRAERMQAICALLRSAVSTYDWVGFYLVDPKKKNELVLGPYSGSETDHTRIKFGQGICGQAADTKKTFVVDDVAKEDNYLSCSIYVKSEIVLPIFARDLLIGELDIDSHTTGAFTDQDKEFLERVCRAVAGLFSYDEDFLRQMEGAGNNE